MDLRRALLKGSLGDLNPFPWVMMTGNCLGWIVYGYYLRPHKDPFLVAANFPGLVVSLWLNAGAAKLQYQEYLNLCRLDHDRQDSQEGWDASPPIGDGRTTTMISGTTDDDNDINLEEDDSVDHRRLRLRRQQQEVSLLHQYHPEYLVTTPQERSLVRMLCAWIAVVIWVGWIGPPAMAAPTVGVIVNLNLVFFYGAPLQTMKRVVLEDHHSNSIHRPTMYMSCINTTFWILYGLAIMNWVVIIPNALGLALGLAQATLCWFYPATTAVSPDADADAAVVPPQGSFTRTGARPPSPRHFPVPLHDMDEDFVGDTVRRNENPID